MRKLRLWSQNWVGILPECRLLWLEDSGFQQLSGAQAMRAAKLIDSVGMQFFDLFYREK